MIAMIDNYDSFTYNLYQYMGEINPNIEVFRNDAVTIEGLLKKRPTHIVISPGPGYPKDAGISKEVIETFGKEVPILGVCLGHQAIAEVFGGKVVANKRLFHGKTSLIDHNQLDLFEGVGRPAKVMRYHSLTVEKKGLPECLKITATVDDEEIMAIRHRQYPIYGVQFHPESVMTEEGKRIIRNFLNQ